MLGKNIKAQRVAAGLSQEELAGRMDVDQAYVSRLEKGELNPTLLTIWDAAEALGTNAEKLLSSSS